MMKENQLDRYYSGKSVVLCGGAGFIGSHLVDALVRLNCRVIVIDPCVPGTGGNPENLSSSHSNITWLKVPIEKVENLDSILSTCHLVIDSMGFTRHHEGINDPFLDLDLNYSNHLTLIQALRRVPTPTVYLGSRGQYGKLIDTVSEDTPQHPLDPQGVHKVAAESMYRIYSTKDDWPCISIRLGNCFGPRQLSLGSDIGLIGGFIRSILSQEVIELYGDYTRKRYLIYVDDLVEQLLQLIIKMPEHFCPINLVGESVLLKEILDTLIKTAGQGSYSFRPYPETILQVEPGEATISQSRLRQYVKTVRLTPLNESLHNTLQYFKNVLQL